MGCDFDWGESGSPPRAVVDVMGAVREELRRARELFPPFVSTHEGYAVLLEELDELWDEVKRKPDATSKDRMRREAVQVAAMAIKFIEDLCR